MSDGPHRSLNMTRSWKRVAERSDKRSFSSDEISEALVGALEKDCLRDIAPGFLDTAWRIFSDPEPELFVTKIGDQLETLRRQAGNGIGRSVLDQAILGAERGKIGREGFVEALKNAIGDRAAKAIRQVEEHYCRESTNPRADRVRARMEEAISGPALDGLARKLLKSEKVTEKLPALKQGLDDGVKLK
jgi:hypothetical protein